jgi:hypothetical protein
MRNNDGFCGFTNEIEGGGRFKQIATEITRENFAKALGSVPCPGCNVVGKFATFVHPGNNGTGLTCTDCNLRHPFQGRGIMWLRGDENRQKRRSNDIASIIGACGAYCWCCGNPRDQILKLGFDLSVHHTRPFADHGEQYAKIPVCSFCHETMSGAQRAMRRLIERGSS